MNQEKYTDDDTSCILTNVEQNAFCCLVYAYADNFIWTVELYMCLPKAVEH